MAQVSYIISGLFTGVVLIALVTVLARTRQWRPSPTRFGRTVEQRGDGDVTGMVTEIARTPLAWTVGFLVLVFVVGTATLASVAGTVPTAIAQAAVIAVALMFASVLVAYLLWGVYHSTRYRGLPDAQATLVSLWVFGLLLVAAVVLKLVMTG